METIDDGGPAFPRPSSPQAQSFVGMSLRDYFAAQALIGWAPADVFNTNAEETAKACYEMADAMLAERARVRS